MICRNCGRNISDNATFCDKCGSRKIGEFSDSVLIRNIFKGSIDFYYKMMILILVVSALFSMMLSSNKSSFIMFMIFVVFSILIDVPLFIGIQAIRQGLKNNSPYVNFRWIKSVNVIRSIICGIVVVFCLIIAFEDLFSCVHENAYSDGYHTGYYDGYEDAYTHGYASGFVDGDNRLSYDETYDGYMDVDSLNINEGYYYEQNNPDYTYSYYGDYYDNGPVGYVIVGLTLIFGPLLIIYYIKLNQNQNCVSDIINGLNPTKSMSLYPVIVDFLLSALILVTAFLLSLEYHIDINGFCFICLLVSHGLIRLAGSILMSRLSIAVHIDNRKNGAAG